MTRAGSVGGMPDASGDDALRALADELRAAAGRIDARRAALGRYALVWWEGTAADLYVQQVAHRVNALDALARDMEEAAGHVETVLALDRGPGRAVAVTRVDVRSEALAGRPPRVSGVADDVRDEAARLAVLLGRAGPVGSGGAATPASLVAWPRAQLSTVAVIGPAGAWGAAWALDALAAQLRVAARCYVEVEAAVSALLRGVSAGTDLAGRAGFLTERPGTAVVTAVEPTLRVDRQRGLHGAAELVGAGRGLDGGRVRVVEVSTGDGGSAWVVVVPGTQEWSPRAVANPFDVTTDLRAMTGDQTLAAAGVTAALARARAASARSTASDPVLLVGHSQGGILAAALAADPGFREAHRVTHVLTTGSPVALLPVPNGVRVLSVEHGDDPVPRLDLTPNPASGTWVTVRSPGTAPASTWAPTGSRRTSAPSGSSRRLPGGRSRGSMPGRRRRGASSGARCARCRSSASRGGGRIAARDPLVRVRDGAGGRARAQRRP